MAGSRGSPERLACLGARVIELTGLQSEEGNTIILELYCGRGAWRRIGPCFGLLLITIPKNRVATWCAARITKQAMIGRLLSCHT